LAIKFFYDQTSYRQKDGKKIKKIIKEIISCEKKIAGDINIVFTDDASLIKINREFLQHNYFTDVISFSYNEETFVKGEIYISVDTVRENSINYNVSLKDEIARVIFHGVLHLCDYDDGDEVSRERMRQLENFWLKQFYEKRDV